MRSVENCHLRLPEMGNVCGLRGGPRLGLKPDQDRQSPNTSHAVSWFPANTVATAASTSGLLRLCLFREIKLL